MLNGVGPVRRETSSLTQSKISDFARRSFDLLVASGSLVITSPLFPLIAIIVKIDSKGPVFFVQKRVGKNSEAFNCYKFRSMHAPEDQLNHDPSEHDPKRVTRFGWYLRKFSFDELPQLINVIQGYMAIVGPRPLPKESIDFNDRNFQRVLAVKPGLISKGSTRQRHLNYKISDAEVAKINAEYEDQRTFLRDLVVLFNSFYVLWKGR